MSATGEPICIAQLSDTHLRADPGEDLGWSVPGAEAVWPELGVERVLDEIAGLRPRLLLATGDLAQDPVPLVYERLAARLARLPCPSLCLPGNHDDPGLLEAALAGPGGGARRTVQLGDWLIVALDSTRPGAAEGELGAGELGLLEETLSRHPAAHVLLALHHPPLPVGSPWLDRIGLTDAPALFELLDRHPQVRGMVCGHVHQALELRRGRLRVFSAPASCVQFEPGPELRLGNPQPGYRRLRLWPDGRLETQAVLLPEALRRSA